MYVYVLHAAADRDLAEQVKAEFRSRGLEAWSPTDLVPGDLWDEEIPRRLRSAEKILVLLTPNWPEAIRGPLFEQWAIAAERLNAAGMQTPVVPVYAGLDRWLRLNSVAGIRLEEIGRYAAGAARASRPASSPPRPEPREDPIVRAFREAGLTVRPAGAATWVCTSTGARFEREVIEGRVMESPTIMWRASVELDGVRREARASTVSAAWAGLRASVRRLAESCAAFL